MTNKEFIEALKICKVEAEVEDLYNRMLCETFNLINIEKKYNDDGYFEAECNGKKIRCIIEYKYNCDLKNKKDRCIVIAQVIAYLKKFDLNGEIIPNVVLIADKDELLVISTLCLIKYLDLDEIDWSIAPCHFSNNTILIEKLENDEDINPWVSDIKLDLEFSYIKQTIINRTETIPKYIDINVHNIDGIYRDFVNRVIKDKSLNSNDKIQIFMGIITNDLNYEESSRKKNILSIPINNNNMYRQIKIDTDEFKAFKGQFNTQIPPSRKRIITSICDRLLEDEKRRLNGEFYTPTPFVDYSQLLISEKLGDNWRDEFVVWDISCGTKNLTRDYNFTELYCSTLEQADLNISQNYNTNSISFQFDFLNDNISKLPDGLMDAFKNNKKIIFYFNPPYSTSTDLTKESKTKGKGSTNTKISKKMNEMRFGGCSSNLYAQFLFRILDEFKRKYKLTNCYLCMFTPITYLVASKYKLFRREFLNNFEYTYGCLFNAGYFQNVSTDWCISFTIWKSLVLTEDI